MSETNEIQWLGADGSELLIANGSRITGTFELWLELLPDTTAKSSSWCNITQQVKNLKPINRHEELEAENAKLLKRVNFLEDLMHEEFVSRAGYTHHISTKGLREELCKINEAREDKFNEE